MRKYLGFIILLLFAVIFAVLFAVKPAKITEPVVENADKPVPEDEDAFNRIVTSDIDKALFRSLPDKVLTDRKVQGKVFCIHTVFGFDKNFDDKSLLAYIWVVCEDFAYDGKNLVSGERGSYPAKVKLVWRNSKLNFDAIDFSDPVEAVESIFPQTYINQISPDFSPANLNPQPRYQAENYYKGKLEVYF